MGVAEIIEAFDSDPTGVHVDLLRAELVAGVIGIIDDDTAVVEDILQVDPVDGANVRKGYVFGDGIFKYDPADETTEHDGIAIEAGT